MPISLGNIGVNLQSVAGGVLQETAQAAIGKAIQGFGLSTSLQGSIDSFFGGLPSSTLRKSNRLSSAPLVLDFRGPTSVISRAAPKIISGGAAALTQLFGKH